MTADKQPSTHMTAAEQLAARTERRTMTLPNSRRVDPAHPGRPPFVAAAQQVQSGQERPKFVAKGHDAQLQHAQNGRRMVVIGLMSGEVVQGKIVRRDRYTITLATEEGELILFKHAIESVFVKSEPKKEEVTEGVA